MPKFKLLISISVLIAALFLLFNTLFTPQPIQIILQSGQEITASTPEYFSLSETLLLIVSAFSIGAAATYLFYNSDGAKEAGLQQAAVKPSANVYEAMLPLLKTGERQAIEALRDAGGEMQQNKIVAKLGISKVKVTRILDSLKQKNLIKKERYGITNIIKLEKKIMS